MTDSTRCSHNYGWSLKKNTHIFIFPDDGMKYANDIEFDLSHKNKLVFVCNRGCNAERNIYLQAKVKQWGKIRLPISEPVNGDKK